MLGVEYVSALGMEEGVEDISALRVVDSALEDLLGGGKWEDPALGNGTALDDKILYPGR